MQFAILRTLVAMAVLALASQDALTQRSRYDDDRNQRSRAGVFDYYVLALSWSPTYCADRGGGRP
jgi:ribonuclease T2